MREIYTDKHSKYESANSIFNIMDHSMYMRYSTTNGVPQESKLANYMTPHAEDLALRQSFSTKLNLGTPKKSAIHNPEFIPKNSSASPSNLYMSYGSTDNPHLSFISAEDVDHISTHVTPESSSPPQGGNTNSIIISFKFQQLD